MWHAARKTLTEDRAVTTLATESQAEGWEEADVDALLQRFVTEDLLFRDSWFTWLTCTAPEVVRFGIDVNEHELNVMTAWGGGVNGCCPGCQCLLVSACYTGPGGPSLGFSISQAADATSNQLGSCRPSQSPYEVTVSAHWGHGGWGGKPEANKRPLQKEGQPKRIRNTCQYAGLVCNSAWRRVFNLLTEMQLQESLHRSSDA